MITGNIVDYEMKIRQHFLAAFTPDPDDAFAWWAIVNGKMELGKSEWTFETKPIEQINRGCIDGLYDVAAISSAAYPFIAQNYAILSSGASVGRGYGPVVATRDFDTLPGLSGKRVAIPGKHTTGALLLRMFYPEAETIEMACDQVANAIHTHEADAGVLIHEELLNWQYQGLRKWICLGDLWKQRTDLPIPVGLNVVKKGLGIEWMQELAKMIADSMAAANKNASEAAGWAQGFSKEKSNGVAQRYLKMFANEDTLELKEDCIQSLSLLYQMAADRGIIDQVPKLEIIWPNKKINRRTIK